jgi:hypothetical protein
MHTFRARFSLSLIALTLLIGPTMAQWTALSGPPGGAPSLQGAGFGISDRGKVLALPGGADVIDPSGLYVYGSGPSGPTRSGFDGVVALQSPSTDAFVLYSQGLSAYGVYPASSGYRPVLWNGTSLTELLPADRFIGFLSGFDNNQAAGYADGLTPDGEFQFRHATIWNGTVAQDLHQSAGFDTAGFSVANDVSGNKAVGALSVELVQSTGLSIENAILWENGSATNLHTQSNLGAQGYSASSAQWIVGDYVFGSGTRIDGEGEQLVWHSGQAQTLDSFLGLPANSGLTLFGIDRLGNLKLLGFDAGGNEFTTFFGYTPNLGQDPNPTYQGPYYGEGFGGTRQLIYENDFETDATGFSSLVRESYPYFNQGSTGLGRFAEQPVSLTLDNLIAGEEYEVTMSLVLGGTWDGNAAGIGPDLFRVSADGNLIFEQSYFFQDRSGATSRVLGFGPNLSGNALGQGTGPTGSQTPLRFIATGTSAILTFQAPNSEPVDNEWWSLDNVQVTGKRNGPFTRNIPEPGSLALVLLAPLGLLLRKRR